MSVGAIERALAYLEFVDGTENPERWVSSTQVQEDLRAALDELRDLRSRAASVHTRGWSLHPYAHGG